jgi:hypothetical protein
MMQSGLIVKNNKIQTKEEACCWFAVISLKAGIEKGKIMTLRTQRTFGI